MKKNVLILTLISAMILGLGSIDSQKIEASAKAPHWWMFFDYDFSCREDGDGLTMRVIVDGYNQYGMYIYNNTYYGELVDQHYWRVIETGTVKVIVYDGGMSKTNKFTITTTPPHGDLYLTIKTPCEEVPHDFTEGK
ncbi:hypothetical protein ACFLSE_05790 [Bacteroidota bacterium]